jgi:Zn-dependent protease with chaperone function
MNEAKASRYQRFRRRARLVDVISGAGVLALLTFTPASRMLADWASRLSDPLPGLVRAAGALVIFVVAAVALWEVAALPASYMGASIDRRFRGDAEADDWLARQMWTATVWLACALAVAGAVTMAIQLTAAWWWLLAGALLVVLLVVALRGAPRVMPLVADTTPIRRASLMSSLRELARRSEIPVSDVLEWHVHDEGRATAFVSGLGRTRRVFVSSAMLRDWSDDEISVVVAHELAHHVYHDSWRTLGLDVIVLSAALWLADWTIARFGGALSIAGPRDLAALPLVALVAGAVWLAATPFRHAQSRHHERRADRFALQLTGEVDAFGAAIRRLSARHLAEERPSLLTRWLFHRHPPVAERLARAELFRRVRRT